MHKWLICFKLTCLAITEQTISNSYLGLDLILSFRGNTNWLKNKVYHCCSSHILGNKSSIPPSIYSPFENVTLITEPCCRLLLLVTFVGIKVTGVAMATVEYGVVSPVAEVSGFSFFVGGGLPSTFCCELIWNFCWMTTS